MEFSEKEERIIEILRKKFKEIPYGEIPFTIIMHDDVPVYIHIRHAEEKIKL